MPIKVLIIDDSALMRALLTDIIGSESDLTVVGAAPDPIAAREMIKTLQPDVLTLDVEMPKMDGLEFLERLMKLRPMPVVMVSSQTARGSEVTLQALELGAVDYVSKPKADATGQMRAYADEICEKIRAAYSARNQIHQRGAAAVVRKAAAPAPAALNPVGSSSGLSQRLQDRMLLAFGSSTGGTEALKEVLTRLPADVPGIVMAQHMPETFTASFAQRLNSLAAIEIVEAKGGELIKPGHAYLAPGHSHLLVNRVGGGYMTELSKAEPVNRHRPSVEVLFDSVAKQAGANAVGVMLTGMGKDGAKGMLNMRHAGAWNIGQDQASCVVYGMPREAFEIGAVNEQAPLNDIASRIMTYLKGLDRRG